MDEKAKMVLLEVAAFLRVVRDVLPVPPHAKKEAAELFDKLGELFGGTAAFGD